MARIHLILSAGTFADCPVVLSVPYSPVPLGHRATRQQPRTSRPKRICCISQSFACQDGNTKPQQAAKENRPDDTHAQAYPEPISISL